MGNSQSPYCPSSSSSPALTPTLRQLSTRFAFSSHPLDPTHSQFLCLTQKLTMQKYTLKVISAKNEDEYNQMQFLACKKLATKNKSIDFLIPVDHYLLEDASGYCGEVWRVYVIFCCGNSVPLRQYLKGGFYGCQGEPIQESIVYQGLLQLVKALLMLKGAKNQHGSIGFDTVYYESKTKMFLLGDPWMNTGNQCEIQFYSPEKIRNGQIKPENYDVFLSDLYSIGILGLKIFGFSDEKRKKMSLAQQSEMIRHSKLKNLILSLINQSPIVREKVFEEVAFEKFGKQKPKTITIVKKASIANQKIKKNESFLRVTPLKRINQKQIESRNNKSNSCFKRHKTVPQIDFISIPSLQKNDHLSTWNGSTQSSCKNTPKASYIFPSSIPNLNDNSQFKPFFRKQQEILSSPSLEKNCSVLQTSPEIQKKNFYPEIIDFVKRQKLQDRIHEQISKLNQKIVEAISQTKQQKIQQQTNIRESIDKQLVICQQKSERLSQISNIHNESIQYSSAISTSSNNTNQNQPIQLLPKAELQIQEQQKYFTNNNFHLKLRHHRCSSAIPQQSQESSNFSEPETQKQRQTQTNLQKSPQKSIQKQSHPLISVCQTYPNGTKYIGTVQNNKREGFGTFIYGPEETNGYYQGNWHNNMMSGIGKLYYSLNKIAYDGQWKQDQFHGFGTVYNDIQQNVQNEGFDFRDMNKAGECWKVYEGQLQQDVKAGYGKLVLQNGEYYQGWFQEDMAHGDGYFYGKGGKVKGKWRRGVMYEIIE